MFYCSMHSLSPGFEWPRSSALFPELLGTAIWIWMAVDLRAEAALSLFLPFHISPVLPLTVDH